MYEDADIYRELAPLLRVRPELQQLCEFEGQWESFHEAERERWAPFYIVTHGECLLDVGAELGIHLKAGDIAVLPHGGQHVVRALPTSGASVEPVRCSGAFTTNFSLARHRIVASNIALVVIAEDVGYQSESAFSRAYHRRFGVTPGADRSI